MIQRRRQVVLAALFALLASGVQAQTCPDKPIRLVVPYAPGGSTALIVHYVAEPLRRMQGQTVVVGNKAGAGGMLGITEVARPAPDGYGIIAPAKVPPALLARITEALHKVHALPDARARMEKSGATPLGSSSAEISAQIRGKVDKMMRQEHLA